MWLLGFMPPKVRNYQAMLQPVVEQFKAHAPVTGEPIEVHNSASGEDQEVHVVMAAGVYDLRGFPGMVCGSTGPCYVGSCHFCDIEGVHAVNTILPGVCHNRIPYGHTPCVMHTICSAILFVDHR
jgi:hypothetical protein